MPTDGLWSPSYHSPQRKNISRDEAARAVYLDFEGVIDQAPALMGTLVDGKLKQVVLDPRLRAFAKLTKLKVSSLAEEVSILLRKCRNEKRLLVGDSLHEEIIIRRHLRRSVTSIYGNANVLARVWRRRAGEDHLTGLKEYERLIRYRRPAAILGCSPAKVLRDSWTFVEKHEGARQPCGRHLREWRRLLSYNKHDCFGVRALTMKVSTAHD